MIEFPHRSVTRFFIPLIDVLTLLFCIFLLMPLVKAKGEGDESAKASPGELSARERRELQQLRLEQRSVRELERLQAERNRIVDELKQLRQEKTTLWPQRLAIRLLEIDKEKLYFYDASRAVDRRRQITKENVGEFLDNQKRQAGDKELYLLILYPRKESGFSGYPLEQQRQEYERWFKDVPHSYDIP